MMLMLRTRSALNKRQQELWCTIRVRGAWRSKLCRGGRADWCFFSSRRRHTRYWRDWSSDVCSSDLVGAVRLGRAGGGDRAADVRQRIELGRHVRQLRAALAGAGRIPRLGHEAFDHAVKKEDRKSVVWGKRVDLGVRRIIKNK